MAHWAMPRRRKPASSAPCRSTPRCRHDAQPGTVDVSCNVTPSRWLSSTVRWPSRNTGTSLRTQHAGGCVSRAGWSMGGGRGFPDARLQARPQSGASLNLAEVLYRRLGPMSGLASISGVPTQPSSDHADARRGAHRAMGRQRGGLANPVMSRNRFPQASDAGLKVRLTSGRACLLVAGRPGVVVLVPAPPVPGPGSGVAGCPHERQRQARHQTDSCGQDPPDTAFARALASRSAGCSGSIQRRPLLPCLRQRPWIASKRA